jgi:quinoprotein glucose dehydrogenase
VLQLLAARKTPQAPTLIQTFLVSNHHELRTVARLLLAKRDPAAAVTSVRQSTSDANSTIAELQSGAKLLSELGRPDADMLIASALQDLINHSNSSPPTWRHLREIELDIVDAASRRNSGQIAALLAQYQKHVKQAADSDPLASFRSTLLGGNATAGQSVFSGHRKAQCLRCHKVNGLGGDAGPDLSKVSERAKGDREYLLESLINPHAKLAKGYGTVTVVLEVGKVISGTVASETATTLVLRTSDGKTREIPISEIEQRVKPQSPMPPVGNVLTRRELRDVVEYLSTLR